MANENSAIGDSLYHYIPTEWVCIIFIVLFSITTLIHIGEATKFRLWWLFPTAVVAGIAEIIGWAGRLWSSHSPLSLNPYLMQITTTIIAPTPLVAANFVILGRIIGILGTQYSRLGPTLYTIVFCACDTIALVVQAVGGASASAAVKSGRNPAKGGNIMLGGIVFQLVAIVAYVLLASEFLFRYYHDSPVRYSATVTDKDGNTAKVMGEEGRVGRGERGRVDRRMKMMLLGMVGMTVCLFIRSVYRTIELADGWSGRIISTQVYFNVLDGAMITLAMFTLNLFHPGFLLSRNTGIHSDPAPDGEITGTEANSREKGGRASEETS